jgi:hypothetical protein
MVSEQKNQFEESPGVQYGPDHCVLHSSNISQ